MKNTDTHLHPSLLLAFNKTLRPLVRFALARRVPIQVMIDLLKRLYVAVCKEEFSLSDKRLTDSRISVITGLQRKDIKIIHMLSDESVSEANHTGPLSRVIAHWRSAPGYQDENGTPLSLTKSGLTPSFDSLVGMISHDIHPRTILDDLLSLDHVVVDEGKITLTADAFLPRTNEDALLGYLANNLGDHATTAVANVLAAPNPAPYFERAVHYNRLSAYSLKELEALSRRLQQQVLEEINARALALQDDDKGSTSATGRFRCGAFIFCQESSEQATKETEK